VKQGVASLKKKAWKHFSLYIRLRDSSNEYSNCITCGANKHYKEMQAGHFVSRRVNALLFDEQNVNSQCQKCNLWNQGEQYKYGKALDLKYGDGTAESLLSRRYETHKFTVQELEQIIEDAKEYIKEMEA
jgi:hypothetical protein